MFFYGVVTKLMCVDRSHIAVGDTLGLVNSLLVYVSYVLCYIEEGDGYLFRRDFLLS